MATGKAARVPISGVHSDRHAGTQKREGSKQQQGELSGSHDGEDHLEEQVWLGYLEAMTSHAHGPVAAHGFVARRMKYKAGTVAIWAGLDGLVPGLQLIWFQAHLL